jgi:hypothetical protein
MDSMPACCTSPTSRHRIRRAAAALAPLLLIAAGCARPGPPAGPPAERPAPQLLRSADLVLPLDAYLASPAEVSDLTRGYGELLRRCMTRYGFDLPPADHPVSAGPRARNERRYGLADPAGAAARGYRLDDRDTVAAAPANRHRAPLPPAAQAALTGTARATAAGQPIPAGGCAGEAVRALSADAPPAADTSLAQRLSAESFARSQRDTRVQAPTRQWAACMKAAGLDYAGPFDPVRDPRFRGPLSPAEIATAEADVACKRETNLVGIWFSIESACQHTLIDGNATALGPAAAALHAQLAAARAALSGGRGRQPAGR